jgi:type I restriction enzyme R subunit
MQLVGQISMQFNTEIPADLQTHEPQRAGLYKATISLVRAFANIKDELAQAGYSPEDVARINKQVEHYLNVREIVRKASGESLDLKAYEADMRHLIDTYIEADEARKISPFDDIGLLDLIVKTGIANAISKQLGSMKGNKGAIAETIENNVRSKIIKEHLNDPAFYETMSALLDELIAARKAEAIAYEEYLRQIAELVKKIGVGHADDTPAELTTPGRRALYNNLRRPAGAAASDSYAPYGEATNTDPLALAIKIDEGVKQVRPDGWRGIQARENVIKAELMRHLQDVAEVERLFLIIKQQPEY